VAFLKFSRDKRGYENYYLLEPPSGGRHNVHGGKGRPRLLFWFRTPPQVKVGRPPFSDEVRKMVEAQNPGVSFDWARIISTPIPSPEVDHWRERRRAEKAAKRAARETDAEADVAADVRVEPVAVAEEGTGGRDDVEAVLEAVEVPEVAEVAEDTQTQAPVAASDVQADPAPGAPGHRRRRRRRRGRRGPQGQQGPQSPPGVPPTNEV
jgi:hypothetical protein